jgi:hypothetical protein
MGQQMLDKPTNNMKITKKSLHPPRFLHSQVFFDKLLRTGGTIERFKAAMDKQVFAQLCLVFVGLFAELTLVAQACVDASEVLIQRPYVPERGRTQTTNVRSLAGVDF